MTDNVHTCHPECPCHTGGTPTPDFVMAETPPLSRIADRRGGQAHWFCQTCGTFDGPITDGCCDVCDDAFKDGGDVVVWLVPKRHLDTLIAAFDDYLLWEPGRAGHAAAHQKLKEAVDHAR